MTELLEAPANATPEFPETLPEPAAPVAPVLTEKQIAKKLRNETAAVRLRRQVFGVKRALTRAQRDEAAKAFDADGDALSARKRLLNTRAEAYAKVTTIIRETVGDWRAMTVPYPENGIRLIRRDRIDEFTAAMKKHGERLEAAKAELGQAYEALREQAKTDLGGLFNPGDYPDNFADQFRFEYDWPNVEPPAYLKQLNPELYQAQLNAVQARFEQAVALTEKQFTEELAKMIAKLVERLQPGDGGKAKIFHTSTVDNLTEFFTRFKTLNIGSAPELEKLVAQAESALAGDGSIKPEDLAKKIKADELLKGELRSKLGAIGAQLGALVEEAGQRAFDWEDEPAAE